MPKFEAKDLGYRDVVVVEVNITWFWCDKQGRALYDKSPWMTWRVTHNIISICRLQRGSLPVESDSEYSDHAGDTVI